MSKYNIDEYIEKFKNLSDHGKEEVCILIDFMEHYERGNDPCIVQDVEKKSK